MFSTDVLKNIRSDVTGVYSCLTKINDSRYKLPLRNDDDDDDLIEDKLNKTMTGLSKCE